MGYSVRDCLQLEIFASLCVRGISLVELELLETSVVALAISYGEEESSFRCPSSISSDASQSCRLPQHMNFQPFSMQNSVFHQCKFF